MAARQQGDQRLIDHVLLSQNHPSDRLAHAPESLRDPVRLRDCILFGAPVYAVCLGHQFIHSGQILCLAHAVA
jgi:hypothetical protein